MIKGHSTVDSSEIEKFGAIAEEWWDPDGKFKPLHTMNPCRLDYITSQIAAEYGRDLRDGHPLSGLKIADVGCGGGLLSEPMARLGATVTGIDAAGEGITVARLHAEMHRLEIDYRQTTAEALAETGQTFDVVLAMEIIEHVSHPSAFLGACSRSLRPGGLLFVSTLNRTSKSYLAAIVAAERLLGWLPGGTHDWRRFVIPDELYDLMRDTGVHPIDSIGVVFNPISWTWSLSKRDKSINYIVTGRKPLEN